MQLVVGLSRNRLRTGARSSRGNEPYHGDVDDDLGIPKFRDLMLPTLQALKSLGGSARIEEIVERVSDDLKLTDAQVSLRRKAGQRVSLLEYRLAWARNYLKNIDAASNSARGIWAITDLGREMSEDDLLRRVREWKAAYNRAQKDRIRSEVDDAGDDDDDVAEPTVEEEDWKDRLLAVLLEMHPAAFERLAQRVLREAGFRNVEVLGKSGDGGLDGVGVYRLSLVSFPVFFQCKRYKGSVGAGHVRDFRGAMAGRGEKGLLITTGTFTRDAKAEASRDGAPPVELVDGDEFCGLLKQYDLGVLTVSRVVEEVQVDAAFFRET